MYNLDWLNRTRALIGEDKLTKLQHSHVMIFGLGGVGSYVVEGLVRSGIENISIVDKDIVDITNINRQLIADTSTIGQPKVIAEKERILKINPNANIITIQDFVEENNIQSFFTQNVDYVIDAIDTVTSKISIIKYCYLNNIKIISCMGTGNKLDASKFQISDIFKTSVCPLAKVIRKELRKLNIPKLKVLYSTEQPIKTQIDTPASIGFVPSVAGLLIAGEVIRNIGLC